MCTLNGVGRGLGQCLGLSPKRPLTSFPPATKLTVFGHNLASMNSFNRHRGTEHRFRGKMSGF